MNLVGTMPLTIVDAIDMLYNRLSPEDKQFVLDPNNSPASVHFHTGMALRNFWKLWDPLNPVVLDFKAKYGLFGHADDISGMVLDAVWAKVSAEKAGAAAMQAAVAGACAKSAESARMHWLKYNYDPATGKELLS